MRANNTCPLGEGFIARRYHPAFAHCDNFTAVEAETSSRAQTANPPPPVNTSQGYAGIFNDNQIVLARKETIDYRRSLIARTVW